MTNRLIEILTKMKKNIVFYFLLCFVTGLNVAKLNAQKLPENKSKLAISTIMQGGTWIGQSPENMFWSDDGSTLYFDWNPDNELLSSLYKITRDNQKPAKVSIEEQQKMPATSGDFNRDKTQKVYEKNGDIFLFNIKTGDIFQITNTLEREASPVFNFKEDKILFESQNNLFAWNIENGQISQLTCFKRGKEPGEKSDIPENEQQKWLYNDQMRMFEVLNQRKEKQEQREKRQKQLKPNRPKTIYTGSKHVFNIQLSPDEQYITYTLYQYEGGKQTKVPNYVTQDGYIDIIDARPKVGSSQSSIEMFIYDIKGDTVYPVQTEMIPGISDIPAFNNHYPDRKTEPKPRKLMMNGPKWSENGEKALINIRAEDNKDRWIMLLDLKTGIPELVDRQTDNAWIAGPGIGGYWPSDNYGWLPDNESVWFQSEESGYSHLYSVDTKTGRKKALTSGEYEIYEPEISNDKKSWYFSANMEHPGVRHFYNMPLKGGKPTKLTTLPGRNDVMLSPDEEIMAIRYSSANQPWEIYLQTNKKGEKAKRITHSLSEEFMQYEWRIPEFITFKARDGEKVHARLYQPKQTDKNNAAIIFVHGAGYLQNAHKWWSHYYREYMFHNILADNGYTVLDIDYRGSAGYGRDWRTGIYRHMGGKDLTDQVDGAKHLIEKYGIDAGKIGIYGGSYGGFITIMAMCKEAETFAAGAALRSVTDWAHYNHGYTSNILNTPVADSLAYVNSSPIYYADGLNAPLLMLHGMLDDNVQFQDVVRLSQRFIELGKTDWELAVFPLEPHSFKEPSSWTNEYQRIFRFLHRYLSE